MPRRLLAEGGNVVFHVLNRGANRMRIFHDGADYSEFERALSEAVVRYHIRLLAYCLMPNHWHLLLWPAGDELPRVMHWLSMTHAKRWRTRYETTGNGHVYQGRYRAIPVQSDHHLLTALAYVERNPVRAALARRAEEWRWSSAAACGRSTTRVPLAPWPMVFEGNWIEFLNTIQSPAELVTVRNAITLNTPLGDTRWAASLAQTPHVGL